MTYQEFLNFRRFSSFKESDAEDLDGTAQPLHKEAESKQLRLAYMDRKNENGHCDSYDFRPRSPLTGTQVLFLSQWLSLDPPLGGKINRESLPTFGDF